MNRWRAEYDDGIWRFYRDGMELGLYEKGDVVVDALNVAESRIAELEAAQRWIPVSERLPEAYKPVLVVCADGYMTVLAMFLLDVDSKRYFPLADVTHWMPLPTPPEVTG